MQKQFCLATEPWIKVIDLQGEVRELSLKSTFAKAHEIRCLAGELPNQDFAVLRFLLAILQTVMYRYEPDGTEKLLTEPEDALRRWKTVWEDKKLPETVVDKYLEEWKERFYLFHPDHPFYQVPGIEGMGTSISPGRMIAAVGESDIRRGSLVHTPLAERTESRMRNLPDGFYISRRMTQNPPRS